MLKVINNSMSERVREILAKSAERYVGEKISPELRAQIRNDFVCLLKGFVLEGGMLPFDVDGIDVKIYGSSILITKLDDPSD